MELINFQLDSAPKKIISFVSPSAGTPPGRQRQQQQHETKTRTTTSQRSLVRPAITDRCGAFAAFKQPLRHTSDSEEICNFTAISGLQQARSAGKNARAHARSYLGELVEHAGPVRIGKLPGGKLDKRDSETPHVRANVVG